MELKGTAKKFDEFAQKILVDSDVDGYKTGVANLLEKANNEGEQLSVILANFIGQTTSGIMDMLFIFAKDLKNEEEKDEFLKLAQSIMATQVNLLFQHYKTLPAGEPETKK